MDYIYSKKLPFISTTASRQLLNHLQNFAQLAEAVEYTDCFSAEG